MTTTERFPVPEAGETLEQYTVRCASTAGEMDPDEFNQMVWQTWHQYRGPTEAEKIAARNFNSEKYQVEPGICVFAEHQTTTAKGEKRHYNLDYLQKIVHDCNDRIVDVSAFPAISEGHTSNPGDPNPRQPQVLGYAGNYRLGRVGRTKPRWAIFHDEYQLKSKADKLEENPRRSVELWTFADGRSYFDPIAAIGSEAPRLPLPQRFQQIEHDGGHCEKYSFQASKPGVKATHTNYTWGGAGAFSTHVPEGPKGKADVTTYSTESASEEVDTPSTSAGETEMNRLSPEDLEAVVAAFAETPQFKFLTELMEREQREGIEEDIGIGGDDELGGLDEPEPEPELEEEGEPLADLNDLLGDEEPEPEPETPVADEGGEELGGAEPMPEPAPEEPEEEEEEDMSEKFTLSADGKVTREAYSNLVNSHDKAIKTIAAQQQRIQSLERRNIDNDRQAAISALAAEFPGLVDTNTEFEKCLYSNGASMSDGAFKDRMDTIRDVAGRSAKQQIVIPEGEAPKAQPQDVEKYTHMQKSVVPLAVKIATKARDRGEHIDWDEAMNRAQKQLAEPA